MPSFGSSNIQFSYSQIDKVSYLTSPTGLRPGLQCANTSYSMHIELLYKKEYVCWIPKGFGMEQALTQPAVKIMFGDSTGFDEMRWTIIFPEKQKPWILYMTWMRISQNIYIR